jgi:hypothetical protein
LTKLNSHRWRGGEELKLSIEPKAVRCLIDELAKEKRHRDLQDKEPKEARSLLDELLKAKSLETLLDEEPDVACCLLDEQVKEKKLIEAVECASGGMQ